MPLGVPSQTHATAAILPAHQLPPLPVQRVPYASALLRGNRPVSTSTAGSRYRRPRTRGQRAILEAGCRPGCPGPTRHRGRARRGMPPAPRTGALRDEPYIQPPTHRGGVSAEVGDDLRRRPGGRAREIACQGYRGALRKCRLQPVPNRNQRHHQGTHRHSGRERSDATRPGMPRQRRDPHADPPAAVTTKEHSVSTTPAKYSGWLGPGATISSPPARHNSAHPSATRHSSARGTRHGSGRGRTPPWAGPRRVRSSSRILTSVGIEPPDIQPWEYAWATGRIWERTAAR